MGYRSLKTGILFHQYKWRLLPAKRLKVYPGLWNSIWRWGGGGGMGNEKEKTTKRQILLASPQSPHTGPLYTSYSHSAVYTLLASSSDWWLLEKRGADGLLHWYDYFPASLLQSDHTVICSLSTHKYNSLFDKYVVNMSYGPGIIIIIGPKIKDFRIWIYNHQAIETYFIPVLEVSVFEALPSVFLTDS